MDTYGSFLLLFFLVIVPSTWLYLWMKTGVAIQKKVEKYKLLFQEAMSRRNKYDALRYGRLYYGYKRLQTGSDRGATHIPHQFLRDDEANQDEAAIKILTVQDERALSNDLKSIS